MRSWRGLGRSWRGLGPLKLSVEGVNPGVKGVNPGVQGVGSADCAKPVEDEVFEEEESAEVEGGLARPCHPA